MCIVRSANEYDLELLYDLSLQDSLYNLPSDKSILKSKIEKSIESFSSKVLPKDAEYIFVIGDIENKRIYGTSQIIANSASEITPHYYFNVISHQSGQILRLGKIVEGISEIAGLIVDKQHRGSKEKIGKQISLIRFIFMAMYPERFNNFILSELMPQMADGRNLFWERFGLKYTGMSYNEIFNFYYKRDKTFIEKLFPKEDIYISKEDIEIVRGKNNVSLSGKPEQHIIEKVGLNYLNKIDPLDGGLQYGAELKEVTIIKNGKFLKADIAENEGICQTSALVGVFKEKIFRGGRFQVNISDNKAFLCESVFLVLNLSKGEMIYLSPFV